MTVFATIFAKNYLAHARTLMQSIERHHPEARRVALLVDRPDGCFDSRKESFEIVHAEALPVPEPRRFFFRHTVLEASTALKPRFLESLFERAEVDRVIYLDPDIQVYRPLTPVSDALDHDACVLTAHRDRTEAERRQDIHRCGIYNLGFLGLRRGDVSRRLLQWWKARTADRCYVDPRRGLFVDQKCMDEAPKLFEQTGIITHRGCNVAWWNLDERPVTEASASGQPLYFFHFSGFDATRPNVVSRHAPGLRVRNLGRGASLFREYRSRLIRNGLEESTRWGYSYGAFEDGQPIVDFARRIARLDAEFRDLKDMFSGTAHDRYVRFWTGTLTGTLTRLAWEVYREREDLQRVMPAVPGKDDDRLKRWLEVYGRREYRLPAELLTERSVGGGAATQGWVVLLDRLRYYLDTTINHMKPKS